MPVLVLVIDKIVVAVDPRHTILRLFIIKTGLKVNLNQLIDLRCFIIKTELKVNLNKLIDLVLIKTTVAALEIESLLGTPLSQRGAVMRATMSFLFAQSKKLVVAVIL